MSRSALGVTVAIVLTACAPVKYPVTRPGLHCDRATRVAHKTLVELGFTVTKLVPAMPYGPGVIEGTKTLPNGGTQTGRVRIDCDGNGATLSPEESGIFPSYEFSRAFSFSFRELVQRPDVEEPSKNVGLQVLVQAVDRYQAQLDLDGVPNAPETLLVRVVVRNNTDRAIRLEPASIELTSSTGTTITALSGKSLDAALVGPAGDKVRAVLLSRTTVGANKTETRFLVFPGGRYQEARISIEDVETGETDGFIAPLQ